MDNCRRVISGLVIAPDCFSRNPCTCYYPSVVNDISMPLQVPDLVISPMPQCIGLRLHISNDIIQCNWKNELRMTNLSDLLSIRLFKKNILSTNVQNKSRPWSRMVPAQLLSNLAELLKRDFVIVAQYRNYPKADNILKGINSAKRAAPVF